MRHVALTGEIPPEFGGLTHAMLQRSRLLARETGSPGVVVTLAHQRGLDDVRRDLRERGLLGEGVELVNLWEELATSDDAALARADFDPDARAPEDPDLHVDEIRRPDGSVLARQWWWTAPGEHAPVTPLGDGVLHTQLLDRSGTVLGGWDGQWGAWAFWLSGFLDPTTDRVVVDSAWVSDFVAVHPLDPPTAWLVHNTHLQQGRARPFAPLERWRAFSFERTEAFDAVVFLTEQQRREVELALGSATRHVVVPNAVELQVSSPEGPLSRPRDPSAGVVVAKLERRKRLDHALRAVAVAAQQDPEVSLRVCGDGPQRETLAAVAEEVGAPVTWVGYTRETRAEYARASFLPLTSRREGLPLVLAEAMAEGCLPVAYDVAYGPADIITHGEDGFLVPEGDVDAFAQQLVELRSLSRRRLRRMRNAARRTALRYDVAEVLPRWTRLFDELAAAERSRPALAVDQRRLSTLEAVSVAHRVEQPRLEAGVEGVVWKDGTVVLTVSVDRTGLPGLVGPADVDLALVDPVTGRRAAHGTSVLPSGSGVVELEAPVPDTDAEHVLWLRYEQDGLVLRGTVTSCTPPVEERLGPWADGRRPVLVEQRHEGYRLVRATPHVLATATVEDASLVVELERHTAAAVAGVAVRLTSSAGDPVVGETDAHGRARLDLPHRGAWKLQAKPDDRWRDVAWATTGPVPGAPVRLTPRGYVRVDVRA